MEKDVVEITGKEIKKRNGNLKMKFKGLFDV